MVAATQERPRQEDIISDSPANSNSSATPRLHIVYESPYESEEESPSGSASKPKDDIEEVIDDNLMFNCSYYGRTMIAV